MTAGRKAVVLEVVLDLPVGLGIGIAGIEHADTLRAIALVEFGSQLLQWRLVAAMVAHKDDVLEAGLGHAVGHLFVDAGEGLRRKIHSARKLRLLAGRREGHHRGDQGVAQLARNALPQIARAEDVLPQNQVRSGFLRAGVEDQHRGLPGLDGIAHFGGGHLVHQETRVRSHRHSRDYGGACEANQKKMRKAHRRAP